MILEYSGKRLALIEWAAANKLLIFITLAVNLFFPWGVARESALLNGSLFLGLLIWLVKVLVIAIVIAVLESSIAKLRIFRVPDLLFTSFILGVIAVGIIIL
ncbi:MAG TPA: NADH-quinone oxidoreductase subunit H, partial [Patescibacteria group bacterium]|nr:NADH-quinone oxidoreductase subunit H [Patescibacteria group bacterium]